MIRRRAGSVPIVAFNVETGPAPYVDAFAAIFAKHGIPFLDSVPQAIQAARARGESVLQPDGAHWNEVGQRIVGEELVRARTATTPRTAALSSHVIPDGPQPPFGAFISGQP
jgi:hypothetical protein